MHWNSTTFYVDPEIKLHTKIFFFFRRRFISILTREWHITVRMHLYC